MKYIANFIGIGAVILYVLSYQQKTRQKIILCNAGSRVLYVLQYILLFAFEGAVLDMTGLLVSLLARQRNSRMIQKHLRLAIITSNLFVVAVGLLLYKNIFSLLPIFGVLFETGALWLTKEKQIRIVSLAAAPFWLIYNLLFAAYGSALGNVLAICSIAVAMFRYDFKRGKE